MSRRISDEWVRSIDGEQGYSSNLTFCGVYEEFYDEIALHWDKESDFEKTRKQYDRDYNKRILPNLENHNKKRICEYTKEDCDRALNKIVEKGYTKHGEKEEYQPSTINHFKHLIYIVFKVAAKHKLCEEILWGTKFAITSIEEIETLKRTKLKKSLTPIQEKKLLEITTSSPNERGELVGLLMMDVSGPRDGEACGYSYDDIIESPKYQGCYIAIIKQSIIPKTRLQQASGKSKNAVRRVPIPKRIYDFIQARRKIVTKTVKEQNPKLSDDEINKIVDRLPIAGKEPIDDVNSDLTKRLRADELSKCAREVFKEIGVDSRILSVIEIEIDNQNLSEEIEMDDGTKVVVVSEKSATAYLLRRNFATHLKILGFSDTDIQYLIGHCIEDSNTNRSDYIDGRINELGKKMKYRPLLNDIENETSINESSEISLFGMSEITIDTKGCPARVRIVANEKDDKLNIKLSKEDGQSVDIREGYKEFEPKETVNVLREYIDSYK